MFDHNAHTDDIDYRAKTRATLQRCVQNRQWAHVARIGGFKSEHDARVTHDASYSEAFAKPEPKAEVDKPSLGPAHINIARKIRRVKSRNDNGYQPEVQAFVRQVTLRLAGLGIERRDLADAMRINRNSLSSSLCASGYMSNRMRNHIDGKLSELEAEKARAAA